LDEEQISCLYIKDIAQQQGKDVCAEETIEELLANLPDSNEINQIVRSRSE